MKKPDATTLIPYEAKKIVWLCRLKICFMWEDQPLRSCTIFGLTTIGSLAQVDPEVLTSNLGKWGEVLWLLPVGLDTAPVRKIEEHSR